MRLVRLTITLAAAVLAVAVSASGEDVLRFETADWILTAPPALGTQADLELNGRQVQLCEDEIERLVGHRPTDVRKFMMAWVVDGDPAGSYATPTGVVNHVPDVSWRLVSPESRAYREQIVNGGICVGPHEVTHVLTWKSFRPGLRWANEGFATFTDQLYGLHGQDGWACCTGPLPSYQRCDENGYTVALDRYMYSDLSLFHAGIESYYTAACFWFEVHRLGGFPAVRGVLAGMRRLPPETTRGLVAHANRVLNVDLRPIVARYGFEASELEAQPVVLSGCTLIGSALSDAIAGTGGPDTICGLAGNDRLTGRPGADVLDGGAGADVLNARDGRRDVIRGGSGRDSARIDRGLDLVSGVEQLLP